MPTRSRCGGASLMISSLQIYCLVYWWTRSTFSEIIGEKRFYRPIVLNERVAELHSESLISIVNSNKKAVLSQRWPRDARYIRRSWAVAEIYDRLRRYGHLKKIFQDGGGRHLGFVRTGNSVIKSAVPEHPTLEQKMKWIGRPVAEIWPFEIFPRWRQPPSWICSNRK